MGGVVANTRYVGDFYRENSMINTNVLEASRLVGANKVLSLLSTCIYPDKCSYPLREEDIHAGEPHASNFAYVDIANLVLSQPLINTFSRHSW